MNETQVFHLAGRDYATADDLASGFATMGYPLTEEGLTGLAAEVSGRGPGHTAVDALNSAFRTRLLTSYGEATREHRFVAIDERWHEEFDVWHGALDRAKDAGAPELFSTNALRARGRILHAILNPVAEETLKDEAEEAATRDPRVNRWSRIGEGDPDGPGAQFAAVVFAEAAAITPDEEIAERKASRRRKVRWAVGSALLAGLVVAGVFVFAGGDEGPAVSASSPPPGQSSNPASQNVLYTGVVPDAVSALEEPVEGSTTTLELAQFAVVHVIDASNPDWYQVRLPDDPATADINEAEMSGWLLRSEVQIRCQGRCRIG